LLDSLVDQTLRRFSPSQRIARPSDYGVELRGGAARLFACREREVLLDGPAGTGKTIAILWYMHLLAANHPGFRGLFVRKTQTALSASALVSFRRFVLARERFGAKFFGGNREEPPGYRYPNGSVIVVGGMDRDTKIMSSEYDAVYVNEGTELSLEDYEAIITRLRSGTLDYEQIVVDCNPQGPTHWINQRANGAEMTRLLSRHEDNPRYFTVGGEMTADGHRYIEGKLDALTGVRKQRLRYGKWVVAEGQVYSAWDNAVHVVDRAGVADRLAGAWTFGTADWGWTKPGVLQVWAVDGDERLALIHEVYLTQRPVEGWWAPKAKELTDRFGVRFWACDPSEPAYIAALASAGVTAKGARNDIMPGISAVQDRIARAGDGRPRLVILADALESRDERLDEAKLPACTVEEIPEYVWPKDRAGNFLDRPVDDNNHGLDCVRYAVAELDLRKRAPIIAPGSVAGGNLFGSSGSIVVPSVSADGGWWSA
jgi:hypothetical protein